MTATANDIVAATSKVNDEDIALLHFKFNRPIFLLSYL